MACPEPIAFSFDCVALATLRTNVMGSRRAIPWRTAFRSQRVAERSGASSRRFAMTPYGALFFERSTAAPDNVHELEEQCERPGILLLLCLQP